VKKPRPATIEEMNKLLVLYRQAHSLQSDHKVGSPLWLQLLHSKSKLWDDMEKLTGFSITRLDRVINGKTSWQELWEQKNAK
jgi:hypothetical protein